MKAAMHIVLYQPEIPPNTGNVARLCAATDTQLHLIEPLGFSLDDRYLKRAGLDYWPNVTLAVWPDLDAYRSDLGAGRRLIATSARQGKPVHKFRFRPDDALIFGPESRGCRPTCWTWSTPASAFPPSTRCAASIYPRRRASCCTRG